MSRFFDKNLTKSVLMYSRLGLRARRFTPFNSNLLQKPKFFGSKKQEIITPGHPKWRHPTIHRLLRGFRIVSYTGMALFGSACLYIIFSEYVENLNHRTTTTSTSELELALGQDGSQGVGPMGFRLKNKDNELYSTMEWPTYPEEEAKPRPKLVILGSGWGATGMLKHLNVDDYDILVISPSNYFLFTPLLPSATVGTLEPRSLLEPIRKILRRFKPHRASYFKAKATSIDHINHKILIESETGERFYVPYDHLVVGVGSKSITFGINGLQYANFLHSIQDARDIRAKLFDRLEQASLPNLNPAKRKQLLSFVVCGGGPTGVEFAAELDDMVITDIAKYFPELANDITITLIQSREHILNTYDLAISKYAEKRFHKHNINLIMNARVKEILSDRLIYTVKNDNGIEEHQIPFGLVLWATGIAMQPVVSDLSNQLEEQTKARALTVDTHLKVKGIQDYSIFALGDCASVEVPNLISKMVDYFQESDSDHDGQLTFEEFKSLATKLGDMYPQAKAYIPKLVKEFKKYDLDNNGTLDIKEFEILLKEIDDKMTSLPATAQVANQQGKYLANLFNRLYKDVYSKQSSKNTNSTLTESLHLKIKDYAENHIPPFHYRHLGSLAYIGNSAVAELTNPVTSIISSPKLILSGFSAMYLWRSVYWSEQMSLRNRLLVSLDWTKRILFGRDLSKL